MLTRTDKKTRTTETFTPGSAAEVVKQFRKDFDIKTDATAKKHLYDLLMNFRGIYQNIAVAWMREEIDAPAEQDLAAFINCQNADVIAIREIKQATDKALIGMRAKLIDKSHPQVGKLGTVTLGSIASDEYEILWDDGDCYWYGTSRVEILSERPAIHILIRKALRDIDNAESVLTEMADLMNIPHVLRFK